MGKKLRERWAGGGVRRVTDHLFPCSGRVGRTFRFNTSREDEIQFDPDSLAFGEDDDGEVTTAGEGAQRNVIGQSSCNVIDSRTDVLIVEKDMILWINSTFLDSFSLKKVFSPSGLL